MSAENPTVGAVICVAPSHVWCAPQALRSCLDARPRFDQIILCYDSACPVDKTGEPNPRAVPPPESGVEQLRSSLAPGKSTTFNYALRHVRTDWLIHPGADDVLMPYALGDLALLVRDRPAHLYYSDCWIVRGRDLSGPRSLYDNGTFSRAALRRGDIKHMSLFFRADRMRTIGGYDEERYNWSGQTRDFWLRYCLNPAIAVVKASRPFVCCRKGAGVHSLPNAGTRFRQAASRIAAELKAGSYARWEST